MINSTRAEQISLIQRVLPELEIDGVEETRGQFNNVLIVNGRYVFRIARTPAGEDLLSRELMVLNVVRKRVTLSVPDPFNVTEDPSVMGYELIPGQPLRPDQFHRLEKQTRERVVEQIATFLKEMHCTPIDMLPADPPIGERAETWYQFYEHVRAKLFPHMNARAREDFERHFSTFFQHRDKFDFDPVLRHGDLGPGNILLNPARRELSGVIDFGSASLGDPAQDIGGLLTSYGQPFIDRLIDHYPAIEAMLERAEFFIGTYALQQALSGLRDGDPETFEDGIAGYR